MADSADLAALQDLLGQASPHDLWDLLPALGRAVAFATGWSPGDRSFRIISVSRETVTTDRRPVRPPIVLVVGISVHASRSAGSARPRPVEPVPAAVFPDAEHQSALSQRPAYANLDSPGLVVPGQVGDTLASRLAGDLGEAEARAALNEVLRAANRRSASPESDDPKNRDARRPRLGPGSLRRFSSCMRSGHTGFSP